MATPCPPLPAANRLIISKRRDRLYLPAALLAGLLLAGACGELRPRPAILDPPAYTEITYLQLLDLRRGDLQPGQKIKVPAYFWEFLEYDPAMVRNYLSLARHPRRWPQLRWFALYRTADMQGYFDLAALSADQLPRYPLKRFDYVLVYGELASLGRGLYLQVHHLEKMPDD